MALIEEELGPWQEIYSELSPSPIAAGKLLAGIYSCTIDACLSTLLASFIAFWQQPILAQSHKRLKAKEWWDSILGTGLQRKVAWDWGVGRSKSATTLRPGNCHNWSFHYPPPRPCTSQVSSGKCLTPWYILIPGNKQCSKSEFRKHSGNCWHNRVVGCQRTTDCYGCCGAYWWVGSTILWRVGLHQWRWKWYTICWNDACWPTSGQLLTWQPSSLAVKFSLALSPETSALLHCMPSKVLCFGILCVIGLNPFQVLSLAFYE